MAADAGPPWARVRLIVFRGQGVLGGGVLGGGVPCVFFPAVPRFEALSAGVGQYDNLDLTEVANGRMVLLAPRGEPSTS